MTRLPRSIDDLRGLRAARWVRESTAGQFDRYGPDAQRELAGRAIARLGLVNDRHWDQLVDHPAGVAVWFADEELLSSEPDPETSPTVQRTFALAAEGATDRSIALQLPLPLFTVRGILTSPLYAGRLRTGELAHWSPLVDARLWERAQAVRARRATNTGRPAARRRPYALPMLRCAGCQRRLSGDTGYYRHREPCAAFLAARPAHPRREGRVDGKGYRREWYEAAIGALLRKVSLRASTITQVVAELATPASVPNHLALARIDRERDAATARYRRDRDTHALEAAMARLDAEERQARSASQGEGVPAARAVTWLSGLADAWAELRDDEGPERAQFARSLFASLDAEGFRVIGVRLTPEAIAHGLADVLPSSFAISAASCWKESGREDLGRAFPTTGIRIRMLDHPGERRLRVVRSA